MSSTLVKCVIVGDQNVGKTCFLSSYVFPKQEFQQEYIPTAFDTYLVTKDQNGTRINLGLFDTSGSAEYLVMRLETYSQTNVFILTFAVDNPTSFKNVSTKWVKEIKHFGPKDTPILLVGLKADAELCCVYKKPKRDRAKNILECAAAEIYQPELDKRVNKIAARTNTNINYAQGVALAREIGAVKYFECSSLLGQEINVAFEEVIRLGYQKR